ncbi:uncharacterized protein V1478_015743 [Vespula squamosa]|uniref:Uncharacterized protein n=1 Tax=Vespula squamosa TaxID=30214 RepID=A0ABD2A1P3_VESSQ
MSKSVLPAIPYSDKRYDNFQEKSTSKVKNLIKLWRSANVKLSLLCNLDNIDATSVYGISRKILFHLQKYYNYVSLKLLPYSNEKYFSGNIKQCYRLDKCQRNSLHLFTKLHSLKKHTRLIHNQKKIRYINHEIRNNYLSINKKQNNKEEINSKINSNYNYTWNSNGMQNCTVATTFFPKIEMEKTLPLYNIVDLFANLNLGQVKNNAIPVNVVTKNEKDLDNTHNDKSTLSDNINSMRKVMMEESFHHPFTGKSNGIIQLSNYNYINTQCKVNFNSGDNMKKACSNLKCLINDISDIPPKEAKQTHSEDVSCKTRSIQWSTEVDVIYYTGDANGDKVIWREIEPLHEEAYQQANHNDLLQITLTNKNIISSMNNYQSSNS